MPTLQQQARALGDPTRHEIFRYVAAGDGTVGVAELTQQHGFNHNAIRQHLAKLVEAELVVESTAPSVGRGRPRYVYAVHPAADSRWGVTGPYERLSVLLADVVRTGDTPEAVGRRAGLAGVGSPTLDDDPVGSLVADMTRVGFDPKVERDDDVDAAVDVVLDNCPFVTTAQADPDTVCELHFGFAVGAAERIGGIAVDELVRKDPAQAGCRLRCHVVHEGS